MRHRADDTESIDYVARQVARLVDRDAVSVEAALDAAARQLPEQFQSAVRALSSAAVGGGGSGPPSGSRLVTLFRLLDAVRSGGGRVDRAVIEFVRSADALNGALGDVVWALRGSLIYSALLLVILFLVSGAMVLTVVPQFESLFRSFGAELPPLTRAIVGHAWVMPLAVLVGAGCCVLVGWLTLRLASSARSLTPLPRPLRALPLTRSMAAHLDDLLAVQHLGTLLAGGLESAAARSTVDVLLDAKAREVPSRTVAALLEGADRLGLLGEELDTQLGKRTALLATTAGALGARLSIALRLVIYLTIALFVVAMYLPLFQLGSTV